MAIFRGPGGSGDATTDSTTQALAATQAAADALASKNAAAASAISASDSATSATNSATTATTQAGIATTKAGEAAASASTASTQASNASASASTATTQASNASTSASNAAASAASASTNVDNAFNAITATATTLSPGASATSSFNTSTKVLTLGVPTGATGSQGVAGATGATGATGPAGATGPGVVVGGTTNQVLAKASATNYDTTWKDVTGTGSVVLNSNPTFATDVTVNGLTVGKGIGTNTYNVAFGSNSLSANTTGINNTALGSESLVLNTSGNINTAVGAASLYSNTTGNYNLALGADTLSSNTTGHSNTATGTQSLVFNETGSFNTALGHFSLYENTASNNTAVGYSALRNNTTATNNTALGNLALTLNTTGDDNTAIGNNALRYNNSSTKNVAVGSNAVSSSYITSGNINNVGIGYSALSSIGSNVATLTNLVGGSGYEDAYDGSTVSLVYQSGTPMIAGGTFPTVSINISGGVITNATLSTNGFGFVDTTTVFTVDNASLGGVGSGFSIQIASLASANNNTALGYNAGNTNLVGSNNVYIGSGAVGTGTNQVVIGAGANAGTQDNSVQIGNTSITQTNITGLRATGAINIVGSSSETSPFNFGTSQRTNEIIIGGNAISSATSGAITLGRSTGNQTVNIANGASASGRTKTVNIGTNGASGSTTVINIGTAYTTSNPTITTLNGLIKQQTYTVVNLPAGTSGSRAFVTNALAPSFGAAVVGGGAVGVPVYHDGTSWKVG